MFVEERIFDGGGLVLREVVGEVVHFVVIWQFGEIGSRSYFQLELGELKLGKMFEDLLALVVVEVEADLFWAVVAVHCDQSVVIQPHESFRVGFVLFAQQGGHCRNFEVFLIDPVVGDEVEEATLVGLSHSFSLADETRRIL